MSYKAMGTFDCDGCKVIESDVIELDSDMIVPEMPSSWLRVETTQQRGELRILAMRHYCPSCAPLIASYLNGRVATDGGHA